MAARRNGLILALVLLQFCGSDKKLPEVYLLTGNCSVEVSSPNKGAQILIDGILVGQDRAKSKVPCGEKQIEVKKHGYLPFKEYHQALKGKPLLVAVKLVPVPHVEDYSLSAQLIADVRSGKKAKGAIEGGASEVSVQGEQGAEESPEDIDWDDWS